MALPPLLQQVQGSILPPIWAALAANPRARTGTGEKGKKLKQDLLSRLPRGLVEAAPGDAAIWFGLLDCLLRQARF